MKLHELKLNKRYYSDVKDREKTFEVRYNDHNFAVKDLVHFTIVNDDDSPSELQELPNVYEIRYILSSFEGLADGYVAFSLKDLGAADTKSTEEVYFKIHQKLLTELCINLHNCADCYNETSGVNCELDSLKTDILEMSQQEVVVNAEFPASIIAKFINAALNNDYSVKFVKQGGITVAIFSIN